MKANYSLDWLRFTVPYEADIYDVLPFDWWARDWGAKEPTAFPSYNAAIKMVVGRADWHMSLASQRKMITFTGEDLRQIRERGTDDETLITMVARVPGVSVTRIDFAADAVAMGLRSVSAHKAWQGGSLNTSARSVKVYMSHQAQGDVDPATTVYFGSEQSEKRIRVYDKGKQLGLDYDWVRVELQARGKVATKLVDQMRKKTVIGAGCAAIKGMIDWSEDWYTDLMTGAVEVDLEIGRKDTNWETWVREVVMPNMEKAIKADVSGARDWLREMWYRHGDL